MSVLHWFLPTNGDSLEVFPNLWAGIGLVSGGAGTALVGSYEELAGRIAEYHDLGVHESILSGYPHLSQLGEPWPDHNERYRRYGLDPAAAPDPATCLSDIDPALSVAG